MQNTVEKEGVWPEFNARGRFMKYSMYVWTQMLTELRKENEIKKLKWMSKNWIKKKFPI